MTPWPPSYIPKDYQVQLLKLMQATDADLADSASRRQSLEGQLERMKHLYQWGDLAEAEYLVQRARIQGQLAALQPVSDQVQHLEALAAVLGKVRLAWSAADQEERHQLAHTLFEEVLVRDGEIVGLKPRPAFEPFFRLNHKAWTNQEARPELAASLAGSIGSGSDGIRTRDLSLDRAAC